MFGFAKTVVPRVLTAGRSRFFSHSAVGRSDFVTDLYVQHIRTYKPAKETAAEKIDLPQTFPVPKAPAAPAIEGAEALTAASAEDSNVALEEEKWPPLYNAIDDPKNFNNDCDWSTDEDNGGLLPKLREPIDYDHRHH